MTKKRVKRITIRIAGKEATRKTGVHTLKTALEAFCGVLAAGLGDVFAKDIFSPEARVALASLLALAVSTAVTAFLNEDQRLRRSTRTFIQVFVGTIAAGVAAVLTDYVTPAFRTGLFSLIVVAASTALAAVMNLQTPSGGGEVVPTEKGGD